MAAPAAGLNPPRPEACSRDGPAAFYNSVQNTKPIQVLHICTDFWPSTGGIEKFVLELAQQTRAVNIQSRVLCLNRVQERREILPARDSIDGLPVTRIPFLNLKYYKPAFLPLEHLSQVDVLHVHGIGALLDYAVITKWIHHRPIIVSTHGGIFHTSRLAAVKEFYFSYFQRIIQSHVDRIVACSKGDYQLFEKISDHIQLVENGVSPSRFRDCSNRPKHHRRFVFVGRLSANKRVEHLLAVFAELHRRGFDFELRIVGSDWSSLREQLEALARRLGISPKTTFVGEVDDHQLIDEYCQGEFFVSASEYEGFGIAALEGMAAGCVPILNNNAGFRNIIENGKSGLLVDFSDFKATADSIQQLASSDVYPMRQATLARAQEFSWDAKLQTWRDVYQTTIDNAGH